MRQPQHGCIITSASARPPLAQISAVLYIPLLHGRIFSAEEPQWNKMSLDVGVAEVRGAEGKGAA